MMQTIAVPILVVLASSVIAAVTDVWKFKVHNALTLPLLATGLAYHGLVGGAQGLTASLLGFLFGFGVPLVLYVLGGMGAGDVKFMAAVGAWLGMPLTALIFLAASLAAGLYAAVLLLVFGNVGETWVNLQIVWHRVTAVGRHLGAEDRVETEVRRTDRRRRLIPFTAMVAVGVVATLVLAWIASALASAPPL